MRVLLSLKQVYGPMDPRCRSSVLLRPQHRRHLRFNVTEKEGGFKTLSRCPKKQQQQSQKKKEIVTDQFFLPDIFPPDRITPTTPAPTPKSVFKLSIFLVLNVEAAPTSFKDSHSLSATSGSQTNAESPVRILSSRNPTRRKKEVDSRREEAF